MLLKPGIFSIYFSVRISLFSVCSFHTFLQKLNHLHEVKKRNLAFIMSLAKMLKLVVANNSRPKVIVAH